MSKILEKELQSALSDGSIHELIDNSCSLTDILEYLGFARGTTKYVKIIRKFLEDNKIPFKSIIGDNRNRLVKPEILARECPVCKTIFHVSSRNSKKMAQTTCSIGCSNTYFRTGINHPNYKGADTYSKNRYREIALKHYGAECQICGFNNILALVVHHIDEDRSNNELDNLIVLCATCHMIAHNGNTQVKISK